MSREKSIDTRLASFRERAGTDPEAFVAGWRDGSIERSDGNAALAAEAEELWHEVRAQHPHERPGPPADEWEEVKRERDDL